MLRERVGACTLEAPARAGLALTALALRARVILPQLEADLGTRPAGPYRIVLIPPGPLFEPDLARLDAGAPPWAAGYMLPQLRLGAIRVAAAAKYPYGTLESVLAHEATHMLLHDAVPEGLPQWFEEGVATWEGRRWSLQDFMIVTRSLVTSDLPSMAELDTAFQASEEEAELAYAASFAFVSWNVRRHGRSWVRDVLREAKDRPLPEAWRVAAGVTLDESEAAWRRDSMIRYRWIPVLTASSTLWLAIAWLAIVAALRRRARAAQVRARWEREEQLERELAAAEVDESGETS